ncbi:galactose ABC transporter substrate-binding protein [Clostridium sp. C2-6-12]|uniref:galactose ABC transporter substrate-binding protein n=1 Tax=Clostridium sp. C2-6-12 TaxID=2698832 RepID=UPI00136E6870|nr:galactose ABC transporter substrate-binding protein [Clostridium sp. C2-6-12]
MRILRKLTILTQVILIIFTLISSTEIKAYSNSNINTSNRKVANIAVLLYSFDDLYMLQIKQSLEEIEMANKDKVKFTFYDGKNNISVQNETIYSLLKSDIDLFILRLADTKEEFIKDIIFKIKSKNIPIIFMEIPLDIVSKFSQYYNKAVFLYSTSSHEGELQGKIIADQWNTNKSFIDKNNDNILQYVLLKGAVDNPYAIERTNDVISAINKSDIKTEQLALVNANWFKDLAKTAIENLFLKYDGRIEAIIANNDAMAIGAIEALQKYGYNLGDKNKYITVVGIDGLEEAKDLIDKGLMTGTLIQNTKMVAEAVYNIAMNLVNNENPIENTPYQLNNGSIIVPESYQEYISKN